MKRKLTLIFAMMLLVFTASAKKGPKYVFYFIGDGMGTNQVMGIQYYLQDIEGQYGYKPLCFTQFPYTGLVVTYSANSDVTDSSAAGTALAILEQIKPTGGLKNTKKSVKTFLELLIITFLKTRTKNYGMLFKTKARLISTNSLD